MTSTLRRLVVAALAATVAAFSFSPLAALAQAYPTKQPIRLIVPYAPAGPTDVLTRLIGQRLAEKIGAAVIIENRAGANSIIASEYVAKSPADGYTLLVGSPATAANIALYKKLPYDTLKDLVPVTPIASTPYFLIVSGDAPFNSVNELIAYSKAHPEAVSYASAGAGGPLHLTAEMFNLDAGIHMLHVPYKGVGPALIDVMAGRVQVIFAGLPATKQLIQEKKLKLLAVADRQRTSFAPDIPAIREAGLANFSAESWFGVFAPSGTPPAVQAQVAAAVQAVLLQPDVRDRMATLGAVPMTSTQDQFKSYFKDEVKKWAAVVKASGATLDE